MVNRRRFLALVGAGSIGALAGCPTPPDPPNHTETPSNPTGNDSDSDSDVDAPENFTGNLTGIEPDGTPPDVPNHEYCTSGDRSQHPVFVDLGKVKYGDVGQWELRISETEIEVGNSFAIELQNVGSESMEYGNKWEYNLQLYTEQGWQEIRWLKKQVPYKDISTTIQPTSGLRWEFYASAAGMVATHPYSNYMIVCPELPPGRYRFICGDVPVAVQFNIHS